MKFNNILPITILSILISGCATASKDVASAYVSPLTYNGYTCQQLSSEMSRVQANAAQLAGKLDKSAMHDKLITTAGVLIFWPAFFALGGNEQQEAQYANLKGQYTALEQSAIKNNCNLR